MAALQPFSPQYGNGQTITTGAAASVTVEKHALNVCFTNLGANVAYVRMGSGTVVATAADFAVPAGVQVVLTKKDGDDVLSTYSAVATTLHVISGEGWK